jgi:Oxysterol-binding protein
MPTKLVVPESEQEPNESRRCAIIITVVNTLSGSARLTILYSCRLWSKLTAAIRKNDMEAATQSKAAVEDAQREATKRREESGEVWVPRYFELRDGLWQAKFQ